MKLSEKLKGAVAENKPPTVFVAKAMMLHWADEAAALERSYATTKEELEYIKNTYFPEDGRPRVDDKIEALEAEVERLRAELAAIKGEP